MKRWKVTEASGRVFYIYAKSLNAAIDMLYSAGISPVEVTRAGLWKRNQIVNDPEGRPVFSGRDS